MKDITATPRTQVRRLPQRAVFDREVIHVILDEGFICHVGFAVDGQPYVIPTGYGRAGDTLYLHGSTASRMLRNLADGVRVCVTVTLLDGLVLARSAYHHSTHGRPGLRHCAALFLIERIRVSTMRESPITKTMVCRHGRPVPERRGASIMKRPRRPGGAGRWAGATGPAGRQPSPHFAFSTPPGNA
jgi:hypothetical protein